MIIGFNENIDINITDKNGAVGIDVHDTYIKVDVMKDPYGS